MKKIATFPRLRRAIQCWLKAGVLDQGELFPTPEGTPQGGGASPLLANVALHGLETAIVSAYPATKGGRCWRPTVIRYADDFVVLHPDLAVIEEIKTRVEDWLREVGLELKPEKTRITHTLTPHQGNVGFDFLGFTIRQFPVGKYRTGKGGNGQPLGFKTNITPSKEAQKRHYAQLAQIVRDHNGHAQLALIAALNPRVVGWANYHRHVVAKATFARLDHCLHKRLWRWATRRHRGKSATWVRRNYWQTQGNRHWVFMSIDRRPLKRHAEVVITRHVKVQGVRSPYDGDWSYWSLRSSSYPALSPSDIRLLHRQSGKCAYCHARCKPGDLLEKDHALARSQGGRDTSVNFQLLHGHCHDRKTAAERVAVGASATDHVVEEPDTGTLVRPVLKRRQGK